MSRICSYYHCCCWVTQSCPTFCEPMYCSRVRYDWVTELNWTECTAARRASLSCTFPGVCSNSSCPQIPSIRIFANKLTLRIRWPKYWSFSFSISPCNEYSRLISVKTDWFDLLAVQQILKSLLQHHILMDSINSSALSLLYDPTFTSVHDYWKNHSFD